MKLFQEFKEFALKGSVVDLAVGVIIGGAFGKIVSSLVNDIVMPPLGLLMGGVDFSSKMFELRAAHTVNGQAIPATFIRYGTFINNVIDFLIVAISIFVVIKLMNSARRTEPPPPPPPNTRPCPYCVSEIPIKAIRCPNCTSDLTEVAS